MIALESINQRVYWALQCYSNLDEHLVRVSKATHKELANFIGCSRESVSRALQELKESDHIEINGSEITLCKNIDETLTI